ncbi:hypothetical protein [Brevibacillus agri]|uniref:hypothetical protein n=1 Tax=Brevibacillus agri TaxID=51101 RepID=UPI001EE52E86|nr:hypothetical protein [Brevibacillus agri]MCG5253502.1 hypothetical protein [Brevibacillus agri]
MKTFVHRLLARAGWLLRKFGKQSLADFSQQSFAVQHIVLLHNGSPTFLVWIVSFGASTAHVPRSRAVWPIGLKAVQPRANDTIFISGM